MAGYALCHSRHRGLAAKRTKPFSQFPQLPDPLPAIRQVGKFINYALAHVFMVSNY
jgi:hypothetical protein